MHRTLRATDEGFAAGRAGEPVDTNPYAGTDLESFWSTGHTNGAEIRALEQPIEWPTLRRGQAKQAA